MRILTIISGVMLIIGGIWCLANPGQTFIALAFVLGLCMFVSGISEIAAYIVGRKKADMSAWILVDGIVTLVLSCIVLSNQLVADMVIPFVFGMWVMFAGILRIATAIEAKKMRAPWVALLVFGILGICVGLYGFFHPLVLGLAIGVLLGAFFLMQGINVLVFGVGLPGKKGYTKYKSL